MDSNTVNIFVGATGLVVLLVGLIFVALGEDKYLLVILPLTGVGASVLATAIVNAILNIKTKDILLKSIITALQDKTRFIRRDHSLELEFHLENGEIKVVAKHRFTIVNSSKVFNATKKMRIYTDLSNVNHNKGGFSDVLEPGGSHLSDEDLRKHLRNEHGKVYFVKNYTIAPHSRAEFQFTSFGYYRLIDRLIWTVQDLSTDFKVKIKNHTGLQDCIRIKVNHHFEERIMDSIKPYWNSIEEMEEWEFGFNAEILPYQGFEVMWDFLKKPHNILK